MFSIFVVSALTMSAMDADAVQTFDYTQRDLDIPIRYDPEQKDSIKELHLYVSDDKGVTWTKYESVGNDASIFSFKAPHDGVFSMAMVIVSKDGTTTPEDLEKLFPAYHIRITSTKSADEDR
jgi:Neuraminidase (sialidase)